MKPTPRGDLLTPRLTPTRARADWLGSDTTGRSQRLAAARGTCAVHDQQTDGRRTCPGVQVTVLGQCAVVDCRTAYRCSVSEQTRLVGTGAPAARARRAPAAPPLPRLMPLPSPSADRRCRVSQTQTGGSAATRESWDSARRQRRRQRPGAVPSNEENE